MTDCETEVAIEAVEDAGCALLPEDDPDAVEDAAEDAPDDADADDADDETAELVVDGSKPDKSAAYALDTSEASSSCTGGPRGSVRVPESTSERRLAVTSCQKFARMVPQCTV